MAGLRVRPAAPTDADEILAMVRELAAFEREPLANLEASQTASCATASATIPAPKC